MTNPILLSYPQAMQIRCIKSTNECLSEIWVPFSRYFVIYANITQSKKIKTLETLAPSFSDEGYPTCGLVA